MIKKKDLTQEDKKAWESYIEDPSDVYDKDQDLSSYIKRKKRFKFDLHGFSLEDANKKVEEVLLYCIKNKYKELLLITGKGIHSTNGQDVFISEDYGKLKYSVPNFVKSNGDLNKLVISIEDAQKDDGGEGALLFKLRSL